MGDLYLFTRSQRTIPRPVCESSFWTSETAHETSRNQCVFAMEVIVARNAPRHHHGDPSGNFVVVRPRRPGYRRLSEARSGRLPLPIVRLNDDVDAGPTTTSFARSQGSFRAGTLRIWRAREREPTWRSGGRCPPAGSRGRAPGQGVRGRSPPKAEGILLPKRANLSLSLK